MPEQGNWGTLESREQRKKILEQTDPTGKIRLARLFLEEALRHLEDGSIEDHRLHLIYEAIQKERNNLFYVEGGL